MDISFWRPPFWISGGCPRHAIPEVVPLERMIPKT